MLGDIIARELRGWAWAEGSTFKFHFFLNLRAVLKYNYFKEWTSASLYM